MVGGAHQWSALHLLESFLQSYFLVSPELFRCDIFSHGVMTVRGLQILADGHNLTTGLQEIVHQFLYFCGSLTQSDHDARLGLDAAFGYLLKYFEAGIITGGTAHQRTDAAYGLPL